MADPSLKEVPKARDKSATVEKPESKDNQLQQEADTERFARKGGYLSSREMLARDLSQSIESLHSKPLQPGEVKAMKQLGESIIKGDLSGIKAFVAANKDSKNLVLMVQDLNSHLNPAGVFVDWNHKLIVGLSGMPMVGDPKDNILFVDDKNAEVKKRTLDKYVETEREPGDVASEFSRRLVKGMRERQDSLHTISEAMNTKSVLRSGSTDLEKDNMRAAQEMVAALLQGKIDNLKGVVQSGKYSNIRLAQIADAVNKIASDTGLQAKYENHRFTLTGKQPFEAAYQLSIPESGEPEAQRVLDRRKDVPRPLHFYLNKPSAMLVSGERIAVPHAVQKIHTAMIEKFDRQVY